MSRRSFFAIAGWAGFTVASLIALYQSIRWLYPNATYEDPPAFKADPPSSYAVGSTTVIIDKRVVINHDPNGFYAISLICTHLGCTPRYFPDATSDLVLAGTQIAKDPDTGQQATKANPVLPGFKKFKEADGTFLYQAPLAQRPFVSNGKEPLVCLAVPLRVPLDHAILAPLVR